MFALRSAPFSPMKKAGWYIDDIVLEKLSDRKASHPRKYRGADYRGGKLKFTWTPQEDIKISNYHLYRATSPEGPYAKIQSKTKIG